jgi:predicted nucleic acid-binding protein
VTPTAVLDANVLYSATLRSVLLHLAVGGCFHAHWSSKIHSEWRHAVERSLPETGRAYIARLQILMDICLPLASVQGFEPLVDGLMLPDSGDRHVLAAAIKCQATVIVTHNLRDFPGRTLAHFGLRAEAPDRFVCGLMDANAARVVSALQQDRARLNHPASTSAVYLAGLRTSGLKKSAKAVSLYMVD